MLTDLGDVPSPDPALVSDDALMEPFDAFDLSVTESICSDTANGWLWYCDSHDSHGNADEEAEARHLADAHRRWHLRSGSEPCPLIIWRRTAQERAR